MLAPSVPFRSVGARLLGMLVLLLVLGAFGSWNSVSRQSELAEQVQQLTDNDLQRSGIVTRLAGDANAAVRKLLVLLTAPREQRIAAYADIDAAHERIETALAQLVPLIDGGEANLGHAALRVQLARYRQSYIDTAELIEAGATTDAHAAFRDGARVELDRLVEQLQALDTAEQAAVAARSAALDRRLARDRSTLLWITLAGALLGTVLLAWVGAQVVGPLRATARAARRMAQGEFGHRLRIVGQGEIAEMASALNLLADEVGQREKRLREMIDRDALSGLPQRTRFVTDHSERLAAAPGLAVLVFDIERLKTINAVLGFDAGDAVIVEAARRAEEAAPGAAARLAGGVFAVLLPLPAGVPVSEHQAQLLAERFQRALERPTAWQGHALDLSITLGVALAPLHGQALAALLHVAEQALYLAKRERRGIVVHSERIVAADAARREHLTLHSQLQSAIEQGQLVPFLQPKIELAGGRVVGAEALVRWQHPERGWVPPAEFIPFAESTGRIALITRSMLAQCVAVLAEAAQDPAGDDTLAELSIAVNISTYDLRDAGFANRLAVLLRQHGVAPRRLQIELTETGLLDSGSEPVQRLHTLRALGVGIAIDDFGVGQSSLAYLQRLPAQELKIDRAFVSGVDRDAKKRELLEAIVHLGHSLGLAVTAEGVETAGEYEVLRATGCDHAQGWFVARPMAVSDFRRWCRARGALPSQPVPQAPAPERRHPAPALA
jgi:diguanylate cyclase (GGDEF)-like protein